MEARANGVRPTVVRQTGGGDPGLAVPDPLELHTFLEESG